jgi:hypothetical protein
MSNVIKFPGREKALPMKTDLLKSAILGVRTIGDRALLPVMAGMVLVPLAGAWGWLLGAWFWFAFTLLFVMLMTLPLAQVFALAPGETEIERRARRRAQAHARRDLATCGLTPRQYIDTIPKSDWVRRSKAAYQFGVEAE